MAVREASIRSLLFRVRTKRQGQPDDAPPCMCSPALHSQLTLEGPLGLQGNKKQR